ncbi:EamA family transporter RarD [Uruburuella testudinis]|uniref:EamA family transporter RarD n=1 Tax=Uruburuella testudinis TaxID=1282863 RepID=A0ABY4DS63_9NEIS|nr:EamA family transporter RarD [Uruburuella testudinis]UOO81872.1 EamA family transporter RarD [Uruburuella testudinis]
MNPSSDGLNEQQKGLLYAFGCYLIWGLFPLYWYPLSHGAIGAEQMLAQRVLWSALFSLAVLFVCRQSHLLAAAIRNPRLLLTFTGSALAISINWLVFLWAITHNHVLDASLGYFISPLFSMLLGRMFFNERFNRVQLAAIVLALTGVLWLALPAGQVPWVALLLTVSFGIYGLLRKIAPLAALPGMVLETLLMLPFAAAYLLWTAHKGDLVFGALPPLPLAILIGSGAATTIPLMLFAAAAKRITMSHLGIIQYFSPTCQFIIGLTVFGEAFDLSRFIGYVWVWAGVAVYLLGIWLQHRAAAPENPCI